MQNNKTKMKRIIFAIAALCLICTATSCHKGGTVTVNTDETPQLANKADSLSWAMGFTMAQNIASTGINIDREIMMQAIYAQMLPLSYGNKVHKEFSFVIHKPSLR